jgi:CRISPR-associated endonuclease Cas2
MNAIAKARYRSYVVVYDISDTQERTKVADILEATGVRVQYSVFEAKLTKRQLTELTTKLEQLSIETGFVRLYRTEQQNKPLTIGKTKDNLIDLDDASIII